MKRITLMICLLLCCTTNAMTQQRSSIKGLPSSRDTHRVVNTLVYDGRNGQTTSGDDFGIVYHYAQLTNGTVGSIYVPHSGNMRLWFSANKTAAYYQGDAWETVCRDSRAPGGDWRRVDGSVYVEITTLQNGLRHVRATFTPTHGLPNERYGISGVVYDFTLTYGNVEFRFNY